ncbi:MAG: hypothetical protein OHK0012_17440 [Synechococcales cyanobacterium]
MTALMKAVKSNDVTRVKTLLQQGVDVNTPDSSGDYPMLMAAYEGHTEILKLLLEAGADVSVVDPGMKATALHAAAYAGRTESAKLLIEYHIDLDKQGPYNGYTALHDAIWQNNVATAQVLIEAGANLTLTSRDGQTPLESARAKKRGEIIALIEKKLGLH